MTREELKKQINGLKRTIRIMERMQESRRKSGDIDSANKFMTDATYYKRKVDDLTKELYKNHNLLLKGLGE